MSIYKFTQGNLGAKKIARSRFQSPVKKKIAKCDIATTARSFIKVCLRCDTSYSGFWNDDGGNDCLDFTTNLDCIMLVINVFGSSTCSGKHDINLTILNSSDVLRSIETVLYSEEGQEIYPVMFEKPLLVKNNNIFKIFSTVNEQ